MLRGTVKWFNRQRRFGWIAGHNGREYFVHQSAVERGTALEAGMQVEFDPVRGERGEKAINVKVVHPLARAG